MPFNPRTAEEIRAEMMAQLVAQSELTDVEEGGVAHSVLGVAAIQNALIERRILALYQAFGFAGRGADLDDRLAQIPGFEARRGPSAASGATMQFSRADGTGALVIPAGIRFASQNDPGVEFITSESFTFANAQTVYPATGQDPVRAVCLTLGTRGNAQAGVLTIITYTPDEAVIACTNVRRMTGGLNRESDESLRWRGLNYFASLCQTSKPALEYLARQFQASDGTRARFAFCVEDANAPGYAELVVDDGTGGQGLTRPGATVTFTTPSAGQMSFHFESPAASTPKVSIAGTIYPTEATPEWVTVHERGVAQMHPDSTLLASAGVSVSVYDYEVFTGLIAELQEAIEGVLTLPSRAPGWRVPGGRVRMVAPTLQFISFAGSLVVAAGYDWTEVEARVEDAITGFMQALGPGRELVMSALVAECRRVDGVYDIVFTSPSANVSPSTARTKLYPLDGGFDFET